MLGLLYRLNERDSEWENVIPPESVPLTHSLTAYMCTHTLTHLIRIRIALHNINESPLTHYIHIRSSAQYR